jgi:hypothetical protein
MHSRTFSEQMKADQWTQFEPNVFVKISTHGPKMKSWNVTIFGHGEFAMTARVSPASFGLPVMSQVKATITEINNIMRMQEEILSTVDIEDFKDFNCLTLPCELQKVFGVVDSKAYLDEMEFWEAYMQSNDYRWKNTIYVSH